MTYKSIWKLSLKSPRETSLNYQTNFSPLGAAAMENENKAEHQSSNNSFTTITQKITCLKLYFIPFQSLVHSSSSVCSIPLYYKKGMKTHFFLVSAEHKSWALCQKFITHFSTMALVLRQNAKHCAVEIITVSWHKMRPYPFVGTDCFVASDLLTLDLQAFIIQVRQPNWGLPSYPWYESRHFVACKFTYVFRHWR